MTRRLITTRYGADALDRLREVVAEAKRVDPMAPVTVLVPNNLAGIVARRELARGVLGHPGIAGLRITTLERLAEEVAAPRLTPRRPLTRMVLAAAWRAELDREPGVFEEVAGHSATVEALVRAHRELRDLDGAALDAVAGQTGVAKDLVRLHRRVVAGLEPDWYDETDLLRCAMAAHDLRKRVRGDVVLYLPQVLSRAEQDFAQALEDDTGSTVVLGLTGVVRADRDVLERLGEPADRSGDVDEPTAARVLSASDSDDEVRCVGRAVLADLAEGVPAHRIAVLHASAEPYARILHERFAAMGVRGNGPGVRAVADRAVPRLLLELLDLTDRAPGQDLPRTELFRALSTVAVTTFAGDRLPLSRWERASREAGVVRGDDWADRLARAVTDAGREMRTLERDDADPARIEAVRRRRDDADALRGFAVELRRRLATGAALASWSALADWAQALLLALVPDRTTGRMPPEEQMATAAVLTVLRSIATLDALGDRASLRALRDVLRIELDGVPPRVGTFGTGVLIAPVSASIGLDLDRVYIVGVAEDLYPGRIAEDALLPDSARAASLGRLPRLRSRLDDRHRALLAAFQAAPHAVVAVPRGDLRRSTHRLPSRWLLPTLRRLADNDDLAMTDWELPHYGDAVQISSSFAGELLSTPVLADAQEWRTRALAAHERLRDPALDAAKAMLQARATSAFTRFDGNLAGATGLPDLLRSDIAVAPTTLESYARCPHTYFMERLLRVRPLEQPEDLLTIRPLDVGNLLHHSLDRLAKDGSPLPQNGEPWTAEQRARLRIIAEEEAEALEARGLTGHRRLWAVERARLLHDLEQILDDDDEVRAQRGAAVEASELTFGMAGHAPVDIPVTGGRIRMKGSADRVDRDATGTLIVIDMKTGRFDDYLPIEKDDPLVGGTKLQLPVYAHAARAVYGDLPVKAEYWFVRRGMRRIALPLDQVEQRYADTVGLLARSIRDGVFPQRPPEGPDFRWVQCPYCNPDGIGHGEARERWEHKRGDVALAEYVALVEGTGEDAR